MELTTGRWLMLRLWVEAQLGEDIRAMDQGTAVEVLRRCFGCTGELKHQEMQAREGLCEVCLKGRAWELN